MTGHERQEEGAIVHMCPLGDGIIMPCCGKTPNEVNLAERMTLDPKGVTCGNFMTGWNAGLQAAEARLE